MYKSQSRRSVWCLTLLAASLTYPALGWVMGGKKKKLCPLMHPGPARSDAIPNRPGGKKERGKERFQLRKYFLRGHHGNGKEKRKERGQYAPARSPPSHSLRPVHRDEKEKKEKKEARKTLQLADVQQQEIPWRFMAE